MNTIQVRRRSTSLVTRLPRLGALAVLAGQQVEHVDGHLGAEVLARVVEAVEEDLGLALIGADVVADLGGPQLAALVALADGEDAHDVRDGRRPRP